MQIFNNNFKEIIYTLIFVYVIVQVDNVLSLIVNIFIICTLLYFNKNHFKSSIKFYSIAFIFIIVYLIAYNAKFYMPLDVEQGDVIRVEINKDLKVEDEYITFQSKVENKKVSIFYFLGVENNVKEENIKYGDVYEVGVEEISTIENTYNNSNSFDYKKYQKSKKVNNSIKVTNVSKLKSSKSLIDRLKNYRLALIKKVEDTYPKQALYINSLILGESIEDERIKENITTLGIIQLFTISGMHISFIILIIEFLLSFLRLSQKTIVKILLILLPVYGILAGSGISIKRVIETFYVQSYFKLKDQEVNKLSVILTVLIVNILLNPYNLANTGFILSYSTSIFLILNKEIFLYNKENIKIKILQNFNIMMIVFPLTNNLTNKFNVLLPYSIIFYNKLVELMIILSFLSLFLLILPLGLIQNVILILLNLSILLFKVLNYVNLTMVINIKSFKIFGIILFYVFYFKQLKEFYYYKGKKLLRFSHLIYFLIIISVPFNILGKIEIIDVGQGDSILIQYPLSTKNILIDTGPKDAEDEIISYLQGKGIKHIDYLILTHNHEDHVGNALEVLKQFDVKNIVVNSNFNNLEEAKKQNKELLSKSNIIQVSGLVKTKIGYFYTSAKKYDEENNNSVIYYTRLGGIDYLFMGDTEKEVEEEIIKNFDLAFIDKIKIGHHGSTTSTSEEFLKETTPQEVFICSGKDNMYGHPSQETIEKLNKNNIKYEDTQVDGEIVKHFI